MDTTQLIVIGLILLAVGIGGYGLMPYLNGDIRGEKRQQAMVRGSVASNGQGAERQRDANNRRRQIADSLKELEASSNGKKPRQSLDSRIVQAGLSWSKTQYIIISIVLGLILFGLLFFTSGSLLYAAGGLVVGGLGIPNWLLGFLRKRRINKFIHEFPNAVDVIIRGVKAGLPLGDCLRIISVEAEEPVRSEFRRVVEAQSIGLTMSEAVAKLYESIPATESNFFAIVINIQQKAGGNLSEALGNLSRVLRDRKLMRLKIQAMSSEAKASAYIIGALPFLVSGMVYLTSPEYMSLLWTHETGRMMMAISGFWMLIGILSMRKMINFDF